MTQGLRRLIDEKDIAACGCSPKDFVLVALSGGADSTALLLSMHDLQQEGKIGGLFAAHLNHGIRGEAALRDQQFCEVLCRKHAIPFYTETADVPSYAKAHGQSLEQAAREVRYAFLERARDHFGANAIATAHHRDDQAETVLLHLIRGSGLTGLGGMKPRNGLLIRPMLSISRAEILEFLSARDADYCEDETNAENNALRNRIRNELLPLLSTYNPAIAESLNKTATLIAQDEAYLADIADEMEQSISIDTGLDRASLLTLPRPIAARIIRKRIYSLDGNVTETDIRRVLALAQAQTGTKIELPNGFHAWTDASALHIGRYSEPEAYETPFIIGREITTPYGTLTSERVNDWHLPKDGMEAYLDLAKLPDELVVRSRRDGDRFFPIGAPGGRKLSDVFTDKKIPKERRNLPLLCRGSEVYYAAGLTIAQSVKVTPESREILHIILNRGDRD